jgi:nucleoside-triphosphatase
MRGFTTSEIREHGHRTGFSGTTIDGVPFLLARTGSSGPFRVGPYTVVLAGLEKVGLPSLEPVAGTELLVLDEVGKMESFSAAFRESVEALLAGATPVLGTVALHGLGFVKKVRLDPRVTLL